MIRTASILAALVFAGCATGSATPALSPQVQVGPGAKMNAVRVLTLSASCGSVEFECPAEYVGLVDSIVRSSMDFAGYALVDPETLRKVARQRQESTEREVITNESASTSTTERPLDFDDTTTSQSASRSTRTVKTTVLDGPGFDDLTVADRKAVLAEAGADSVLKVRIVVGAQVGVWAPNQNVEVMVKLGVAGGDTMAWASRCIASSNDFQSVNAALENAARCAVYGGTGN